MALVLLATSVLARLAGASVIPPHDVEVLYPRQPFSGLSLVHGRSPAPLVRRADETFDLEWAVQDQSLFSANWTGGTGRIPLGPTPFETSLATSFSLVLECLDCRTYGNIVAEFNHDDGLNATLTFNNVGAYLDFGVFSSNEGTFTIGLGRFFGNGNRPGQLLSADIGFGLDLVLQFSGEVQASGGFQMAIPDGEQVGIDIDFDFDLDDLKPELDATARINVFPHVDFSLLPIELSNADANITAALVLRTEAGVGVDVGGVEANAKVGAHLALVAVSFGAVHQTDDDDDNDEEACEQALFVDIECNAGAFAQAGARIPGREFEVGPDVSTVFASAGTTTCLGTKSPVFRSTRTAEPLTAPDAGACPTALVTAAANVTKTYSMTSCVVAAVNCPESLTQVVVVTHVEEAATVQCPVNATVVPTGTSDFASTSATATATPVIAFSQSVIAIAPLTALATSSNPPSFGNATTPVNATVVGVFETVSVPPPPPSPTPNVNVGGGNDTDADEDAAAGLRVPGYGGGAAALVGVALWVVVVL